MTGEIMSKNIEVNKKCAELLGLTGIKESLDDIIYTDFDSIGEITRLFNIYDPERVDAYKVAAKLELDINFTKLSKIWFVEDDLGNFRAEDEDQYTAIVKCIESIVGDL